MNDRARVPVSLRVTGIERRAGAITHLHGVNQSNVPWRLAMADAVAALQAGHYAFAVVHGTKRRKAAVHVVDGRARLVASTSQGDDLIEHLPLVVVGS